MAHDKERFSSLGENAAERIETLDMKRYIEDPAYRKNAQERPGFASFSYYEQTDQLGSILADRSLNWHPKQKLAIKKEFAKELVLIYPSARALTNVGRNPEDYVEKDLDSAEVDARDLVKQLRSAEEQIPTDEEVIEEPPSKENLIVMAEIAKAEGSRTVDFHSFNTNPMYRLILREKNSYFMTIAERERIDLLRKIIQRGKTFLLGSRQADAILASIDGSAEEELRAYAEESGLLSAAKLEALGEIMKKGVKREGGAMEEFKVLKQKYLGGGFKNQNEFKTAIQTMLREKLRPQKRLPIQ